MAHVHAHDQRVVDEVDVVVERLLEAAEQTSAIVDRVHPRADEADARVGVEDLDLPREPRRQAGVVCVEASDVLAARFAQARD